VLAPPKCARSAALGLAVLGVLGTGRAAPAGRAASAPLPDPGTPLPEPGYAHLFGGLMLGRGVRFNNPYRLSTVLGDDAESLSLTATYLDLSLGAALGAPDGLQHGAVLGASIALAGVPQEVLTPAYIALLRLPERVWLHARGGLPVVVEPDFNVGAELAIGGAFLVSGGLGFGGELVTSLFYGAASHERTQTAIPIVSLELGVVVDCEVFQ